MNGVHLLVERFGKGDAILIGLACFEFGTYQLALIDVLLIALKLGQERLVGVSLDPWICRSTIRKARLKQHLIGYQRCHGSVLHVFIRQVLGERGFAHSQHTQQKNSHGAANHTGS